MKKLARDRIDELIQRYPVLGTCRDSISLATDRIIEAYTKGNKIMVCGNGGSAADSLHIVGELMKAFACPRQLPPDLQKQLSQCEHGDYIAKNLQMALPTISLVSEAGLLTAYANDVAPDMNFAQQVFGQGKEGDILITISTSGNSANVIYAAEVARACGIQTISMTGLSGGRLRNFADILINVPEDETFKIQELHLPVYHAMCLAVETEFYGEVY